MPHFDSNQAMNDLTDYYRDLKLAKSILLREIEEKQTLLNHIKTKIKYYEQKYRAKR